jgi:hypothetical protein
MDYGFIRVLVCGLFMYITQNAVCKAIEVVSLLHRCADTRLRFCVIALLRCFTLMILYFYRRLCTVHSYDNSLA